VKAILVNIFGGIVRCDRVAAGIIEAAKTLDIKIPVIVRLEGTNADLAKSMLDESGLNLIPADNFKHAAEKVTAAIQHAV
jgi:succinyl-CoA synthetase beta subunit